MKIEKTKKVNNLLETILKLNNLVDAQIFFRDLLTEKELEEFAARWQVARMLHNGNTYIEIEKETGLSSATIARISKWLHEGRGGYKKMLDI